MNQTFDQRRQELRQSELFDLEKTAPHVALQATMVLEPNTHQGTTRVRVTARDDEFNVLWGANVSEGMLDPESSTEVGFYSTLRKLIRDHLPDARPQFETTGNPYESIEKVSRPSGNFASPSKPARLASRRKAM